MNDICPYLCSFKSNSGYCNRTGGYDGCQYRKVMGYDYEAKRFYVEPVDSYEEACGVRPMTNADKIRQMSDEELAERFKLEICKMVSIEECQGENCKACRLKWLRKEANDGN